jgi:hypothetical protein
MRTEKQREASRRNGAKSRGPITPAGKHHPSCNSRRHGLYSVTTPASHESLESLRSHLESTYGAPNHQPDPMIEAAIHAIHSFEQIAALARQRLFHPDASRTQLTARAFRRLADESGILNAIHRFESRSERLFLRAIALLDRRRSENPSALPKTQKNKICKTNPATHCKQSNPHPNQNPAEPTRTQQNPGNPSKPGHSPGKPRPNPPTHRPAASPKTLIRYTDESTERVRPRR